MNTDDPVVLEVGDGLLARLYDALKLEQSHDDLMKPYSAADALAAMAAMFVPSVSAGDAVVRTDPWARSGRRWNGSTEAPGTFEARVNRNRAKAKAAKAARKKQRRK